MRCTVSTNIMHCFRVYGGCSLELYKPTTLIPDCFSIGPSFANRFSRVITNHSYLTIACIKINRIDTSNLVN